MNMNMMSINQQTPAVAAMKKRPRTTTLVRFNSLTKVATYQNQQQQQQVESTWYNEQEMLSFRYQARDELYSNNPQRVTLTKEKQLYKRLTIKTVVDAHKRYNNNNTNNHHNNNDDEIVASIYQKCTHYFATIAQLQAIHDEYECNSNGNDENLLACLPHVDDIMPPKFPFPYKRKSTSTRSSSTLSTANKSSSPKRSYMMESEEQQQEEEGSNNKRRRLVAIAAMAC